MFHNVILFLAFFFSFFVGCVSQRIHDKRQEPPVIGDLRIDHSDPDGAHLFLELKAAPDTFANETFVTVAIKNEDLIPRK